jgi:glycosyltransferase involved in cell wall biosynthesis
MSIARRIKDHLRKSKHADGWRRLQLELYKAVGWRLRQKVAKAKAQRAQWPYCDKPKLTLVLEFFNKRRNVRKLVEAFRASKAEEIIVLEDGSVDGSISLWAKYLNRPNEFVLRANDLFEIRMYARALAMARGEYVCLLQDDDIPPVDSHWVDQALQILDANPDILMLGGRDGLDLLMPDATELGVDPTYKVDEDIAGCPGVNKYRILARPEADTDATLFSYAMVVNRAPTFLRRKEFLEIGGIDESYAPFQCDDVDASLRTWLNGYKVAHYWADFSRNIGMGGIRLFNASKLTEQAAKNWREIYARYGDKISSGELQALVNEARNELAATT